MRQLISTSAAKDQGEIGFNEVKEETTEKDEEETDFAR